MTFVNYYEVLEISQSADVAAIKDAIRKQRRDWRNRSSHPKAETRALAERMTQHISDAESVLLDASKRADYDLQLAAQSTAPERPDAAGGSGTRDWVAIAASYLADGSASRANYAAREATQQNPDNPDAWYVRGVSSSMLQNLADAEFELSEAIRLQPNNASYHCEMGDLYNSAQQWNKAQVAYQRASDLEPDNHYYRVGVATTYSALGEPGKALPILEKALAADASNDLFKFHYAVALADDLTSKWSQFGDGSSSILNEAQLEVSKTTLAKIRRLGVDDPEFREHLDEIARVVGNAELVRWYGSDNVIMYLIGFGVSLLLLFGFNSQSTVLLGLIGLAGLIGIPFIFVSRHRVPGWKWDSRRAPAYAKKSGLQAQAPGQF